MKIKVYIFIYLAHIESSLTTENINALRDKDNTCSNGYCGSTSYSHLRKVYKGLFLSHSDIAMLDSINNAALATPLVKDEPQSYLPSESSYQTANDGAICCSTRVQHIANTTMVNIFGVSTSIVHLSDASESTYQYIPHATCVEVGICPGECVIESKIMTLLTLDADQQFTFDLFEVPGYCSCRSFTSAKKS